MDAGFQETFIVDADAYQAMRDAFGLFSSKIVYSENVCFITLSIWVLL